MPDRSVRPRAREIGIKALQTRLSSLIDQLPGDRRLLVTRRGRPVAVLLSVEEARDYLIGYSDKLVQARLDARTEHAAGESLGPAGVSEHGSVRYRVRLSKPAAARLEALDPQYQARVRAAVRRLAIRAGMRGRPIEAGASLERIAARDGPVYRLDVGYEWVTCDVDDAERIVLVLAIAPRWELDRELRS